MKPDLIIALWGLDRLTSDSIVEVACDWLVEGRDSQSLRWIAGATDPKMSEVGPLFSKAIAELGFTVPDRLSALLVVAKEYAQQIIEGSISPHSGAERIWREVADELESRSELLLSFIGAADELGDLSRSATRESEEGKAYERKMNDLIVARARELIEATEPNHALQATSVTRGVFGKVSNSDRTQRGA